MTLTADLSTLRATQDRIGALQNEAILFLLAAIEDQRDDAAAAASASASSSDASHSGSGGGRGGGREGGAESGMIDSWNPVEHGIPSDLNQLHVRLLSGEIGDYPLSLSLSFTQAFDRDRIASS